MNKCGKLKHIAQSERKSNKKKTEKIIYMNINKIKSRKTRKIVNENITDATFPQFETIKGRLLLLLLKINK